MLKVFSIDTSTSRVVACYFDDDMKCSIELETKAKHGIQISQVIKKMPEVNFRDLDCVGIGIGPGSLTGLRVGIAFASGLGVGKKFVQINSLKLIASNLEFYEGYIVVVRKAREGYLYGGVYHGDSSGRLVEIERPFIDDVESIREKISCYEPKVCIGDGAEFFEQRLESTDYNFPSARKLFKLTVEEIEKANFVELVEPLYLQKSIAELNFEKKQRESK
ncbi:MAG TPA: tRNA (adenosine(37)-N6)-threonylcarbamoyltransferase complex dimerization subunit type 1 TsaB [Fervidobacterium sp.]|nr:tRNA (adenosine(37)-N6)-threonylcarbamoyltransferase complex dimerization subunit type 1 TsaB [Fervidobacterium sp.]HUM75805.1 tRNA (adenosine(37)-N6)-threonylcarbamoyltransferase complex dimerization subunit type 1 TsaB [Fervidobacterium sp.]